MHYTSRGLSRRGDTDQWKVTLSHRDPLTGKLMASYHTVHGKTERQAKKARDTLIKELEDKGAAATSQITLREFIDEFIRFKAASKSIEESTVYHYRKDARVVCRYIGDVRLADVTIPVVSDWMAQMTAEGYAPRTVAKPFAILRQAMKHAMACDLITKNPCDYCKPPKAQRKQVNALDRDERTRMVKLARNSGYGPLSMAIEIALMTGMRRGEVCGLRWSDLGDDATITVNRSIAETKGGVYVKEPKTPSSLRTIPLTPRLFAYLKAMRADSQNIARKFDVAFGDPYILGTQEPDSKPYQPTRLTREFQAFCREHNFDCTFHDLRHTFATMMIANGTDVRTVASYLGHTNVAMTLNTYAEVDPDAKRAAVSKIQDSFDIDDADLFDIDESEPFTLTFSIEQLEAMLAEARAREASQKAV